MRSEGNWPIFNSSFIIRTITPIFMLILSSKAFGVDVALNAKPSSLVGVNLPGISKLEKGIVFNDLMKEASPWGADLKAPCWGTPGQYLTPEIIDADGWPITDAGVCITSQGDSLPLGVYKLSFTGQANLGLVASTNVVISPPVYNAATNTTTADLTATAGAIQIVLTFQNARRLDPSDKTVTGVKNVKLFAPAANVNELFYAPFLAVAAKANTVRFMDWLSTNANPSVIWADRTLPAYSTQRSDYGASIEYAIALANKLNKDAWFNVPLDANDLYVQRFAQVLKFGADADGNAYTSPQANPYWQPLNSNLFAYIEYSNETWNNRFIQFKNLARKAAAVDWVSGKAYNTGDYVKNGGYLYICRLPISVSRNPPSGRGDIVADGVGSWSFIQPLPAHLNDDATTNPYILMVRTAADRAIQISKTFQSVFGGSSQLRMVYAGQYANPAVSFMPGLEYMSKVYGVNNTYGNPSVTLDHYFYGLAVAPYFPTPSLDFNAWPHVLPPEKDYPEKANTYTIARAFRVGEYATVNGSLYRAKVAITGNWQTGKGYSVGSKVISGGKLYEVVKAVTTSTTAPVGNTAAIVDGNGLWKYVSGAKRRVTPAIPVNPIPTSVDISDGDGTWKYIYTYDPNDEDFLDEARQALVDVKEGTDAMLTQKANSAMWDFMLYATYHHLHPISYEGGLDTSNDKGMTNVVISNAFLNHPGFRTMMTTIYTNWHLAGAGLFNYFNLVGQPRDTGTYGMISRLDQPNTARFMGFQDVLNSVTSLKAPVIGVPLPSTVGAAPKLLTSDSSINPDADLYSIPVPWSLNNISYGHGGGYAMVLLNAPVNGVYQMSLSVNPAGTSSTGNLTVYVDSLSLGTFTTGTRAVSLPLSAGHHAIRFVVEGGQSSTTGWAAPAFKLITLK